MTVASNEFGGNVVDAAGTALSGAPPAPIEGSVFVRRFPATLEASTLADVLARLFAWVAVVTAGAAAAAEASRAEAVARFVVSAVGVFAVVAFVEGFLRVARRVSAALVAARDEIRLPLFAASASTNDDFFFVAAAVFALPAKFLLVPADGGFAAVFLVFAAGALAVFADLVFVVFVVNL
jgi:hypothetical protein